MGRITLHKLILFFLALTVTSCVSPQRQPELSSDRVSLLTFNVENLFDTEDDPVKNDEAFLPIQKKQSEVMKNKCRVQNQPFHDKKAGAKNKDPLVGLQREEHGMDDFFVKYQIEECLTKDWSPKVLDRKMRRLTDVLEQVNHGFGPDIVMLQEVENESVLKAWRDKYLAKMGYQTLILLEGPDERGIDTAILSRLPQMEPAKLHKVDLYKGQDIDPNEAKPTRGILEARLRLPDGQPLAVFAVHFPSQGAPSAHRRVAAEALLEAASHVSPGTPIIVGGDFNITSKEEWKKRYFRDLIGQSFAVSFMVGLHDQPGSSYYKYDQTWSYFDVLLFSKSFFEESSPWKLDPSSLRLINSSVYQTDQDGKPAKFRNGYGSVGVSDHWPVYAEIKIRNQKSPEVQ